MRGMKKLEKLIKKVFKNTKKQIKKLARALGFNKKQSVELATKNARNLIESIDSYRKIGDLDQNSVLTNISWDFFKHDFANDEASYEIPRAVEEPIYETIPEPIYENVSSAKDESIYDYLPPARPISGINSESNVATAQVKSTNVKDVYNLISENESIDQEKNSFER